MKVSATTKEALWEEARKRFHLSHEHVRMGKALGMNPKKLGKLANHKQEPWKAPLPIFIEECYCKQFKKQVKKSETSSTSETPPVQAAFEDNIEV